MCGRFAQGVPRKWVEETFGFSVPDGYQMRYNVAPLMESLVVRHESAALLRWGLVPHWAADSDMGARLINARSESVFEKPAFRESVRSGRCLVPVQAFYEWQALGKRKQPFAALAAKSAVLVMAGICSSWVDGSTGKVLDTFAVLTCAPNNSMKQVHERMPVVLPPAVWREWMDPFAEVEQLQTMLVPCPDDFIHIRPISSAVNKVANNSSNLLDPVEILKQGSLL